MALNKKNKFFRGSKPFKFKNKKGFFFTIDALLAASILLGGLLLLSSYYINTGPTVHLNYLSQDIINSLDILEINELNNSYVDDLIANENIIELNNSILQQAGEFWVEEEYSILVSFMGNVTQDIIPERYGFGLWIGGDLIYKRDNPSPLSRSVARKLVSGIEKQKPIQGFISKARANNYILTSTEIIPFSPEGAGWDGSFADPGEGVIDKYFSIPSDMDIINATFYLSLHIEDDGVDWEVININNGACTINRDEINFIGGEGTFDKHNILGCINNGENEVKVKVRNMGYNGHLHPGMLIKIDYNKNESIQTYNQTFSKRYYFDNVVSNEGYDGESGAWESISFYVPENAEDINVTMHIEAKNVRDYTGSSWFYSWSGWRRRRDYDYIVFVNSGSYFDRDAHPSLDETYHYNPNEMENELLEGTNVVSVYLNNYGDYEWGSGQPQIYSDPFNNPDTSSYIEVNYSLSEISAPYGSIKITNLQEFGGGADWEKETSFSFPEEAIQMGDIYVHTVQQYSYIVDVEADAYTPPGTLIFSSPSSRAVPTTVYIPKTVFELSPIANNYVMLSDRNHNDILPESAIEYSFYVPSFVGYGVVFANQTDAEDDAMFRLNQTLGDFISAENIVVESSEMTGVPTMWGPTIMEVRVWH